VQASDPEAQDARRGLPQLKGATVIAAHDYRLTVNSTRFAVTAPGAGLIVLQEAYEKGQFAATVNDQPARIVRVNHAFKGIPVAQAGEYEVAVTYRPPVWTLALRVLWFGLPVLLAGIAALALIPVSRDLQRA
jgi:uncharacterized membrane protein YfhO